MVVDAANSNGPFQPVALLHIRAWATFDLELKGYLITMNYWQVLKATKCYLAIARTVAINLMMYKRRLKELGLFGLRKGRLRKDLVF
ncbi:hypothetical protein QYF61_000778, partial [Mycteria americana]